MFSFVIKRLLQAILVMLIVTLIAFLLFQFVGDPVTQMLGQDCLLYTSDAADEL